MIFLCVFVSLLMLNWSFFLIEANNRCIDVISTEAQKMSQCNPRPGYTWNTKQQKCILDPSASCAKTSNKFIHMEVCLESIHAQ